MGFPKRLARSTVVDRTIPKMLKEISFQVSLEPPRWISSISFPAPVAQRKKIEIRRTTLGEDLRTLVSAR